MKNVNAYYRKHKTLEGCEDLTPDQAEKLTASMQSSWHYEDKPYATWALTNNNATIHATEKRIEELKKLRHREPQKQKTSSSGL